MAALPALGQQRRPNILFILADDLGYGDVGCYGQKEIATPNIDRLASEGLRFTSAYAGDAECAPSRCCLMTGLHTGHTRIRANADTTALTADDLTVTDILHKASYRTALYGKWALGGLGTAGYPTRKGIDDWFGYFNQLHAQNYYPEMLLEGEHEVMLMGNAGRSHKEYTADLFTARAIRFLEQNRERRSSSRSRMCRCAPGSGSTRHSGCRLRHNSISTPAATIGMRTFLIVPMLYYASV
jgi:arylsulfatase A